jgi:phosphoglycerate dehydrogenase-like enzyme
MKIGYLLQNPGLASVTPEGWEHAVIAAEPDGGYSAEDLERISDADFLVVGLEPVPEAIFEAADDLRLVQRLGVGYDAIDLDAAARRGVPVCNMPDFNAGTVAEHTIALILALKRRLFESTMLMKAGHWPLGAVVAGGIYDLQGKTVGIVGLGKIGLEVARRLQPFDVRLLYNDTRRLPPKEESSIGAEHVPLNRLLVESDIVTLHAPLTPENRGLLSRDKLELMKSGGLLINTARGALVDEEALAAFLREGRIAGAAVDVFAHEPPDPNHPLRGCRNIVLTPHTAGQTREAMDRMVKMMLENVQRVSRGEEPMHRVA